MNQALPTNKAVSLLIQVFYIIFFASFICSFRAITSMSLAAILLCGIIQNSRSLTSFFSGILKDPFLLGCILFFLLQFVAMLYTRNTRAGWDNIRLKSGLLFIPLALYSTSNLTADIKKRLWACYCMIIASVCIYCLFVACWRFSVYHEYHVFFYHSLVRVFSQHAVYFSIFVFTALLFLLEDAKKKDFIFQKGLQFFFIVLLSVFLFLLSSKLVIAFFAIYLLTYLISLLKNRTINRVFVICLLTGFIIAGGIILLTKNPISKRFADVLHGDIRFITRDKFDKGDYFNGIQFRLLQWRLTPDILNNTHSWLMGVSPGDAQTLIDQEYTSRNMYTGDPAIKNSKGFLGYNTHNQFLESLLQTGVPGLLLFMFLTFWLIRTAIKSRSRMYSFIIALLIIYSLTESLFETQYGILLYTFLPLFTRPSPHKE